MANPTAHMEPMRPIATIGYEQATQADVIARLRSAGVELLIDVRAVAASRRAGFSKTLLASSLQGAGIDYLHLRDLGTPKAGREAARAGRCEEMREIYAGQLEEPAAVLAFERTLELARARTACLLCYEADPGCCHRELLARRLSRSSGAPILHL